MRPKPILLMILDGWGYRPERDHNPTLLTPTPTFDYLFKHYPNTLLEASGEAVGLPKGQIGNSEVGHLHIGSGRKVPQDLVRIDSAIKTGNFFKNPVFLNALQHAKKNNRAVHILGLLSPGGVHSQQRHIVAMMDLIAQQGISKNYLHAFLDGRDVAPKSAMKSLQMVAEHYKKLPGGYITSIIGRYYAMDRDQRWPRTEKAYNLLTAAVAEYHAASAEEALSMAYARGESDEFVKPTTIQTPAQPAQKICDGDVVIFMNFRADRARQLTRAFTETHFEHFPRKIWPKLDAFITLTEYAKDIHAQVAYPPLQLNNTLGEFLAHQGLHQLRIAETEKYAHVTYFLNGGIEQANLNEDRILIPSPQVATYDLKPEMSAYELTDRLIAAIHSGKYDVIFCNYANPDMIGHTGIEAAANKAVAVMDECMKRVLEALQKAHGEALITADHGNIELIFDETTGQPHTAHTENPVPFIYVGRSACFIDKGALDDVAPTLLYVMNLQPPPEMTGKNLLAFKE